jgi:hypothetical protein
LQVLVRKSRNGNDSFFDGRLIACSLRQLSQAWSHLAADAKNEQIAFQGCESCHIGVRRPR